MQAPVTVHCCYAYFLGTCISPRACVRFISHFCVSRKNIKLVVSRDVLRVAANLDSFSKALENSPVRFRAVSSSFI